MAAVAQQAWQLEPALSRQLHIGHDASVAGHEAGGQELLYRVECAGVHATGPHQARERGAHGRVVVDDVNLKAGLMHQLLVTLMADVASANGNWATLNAISNHTTFHWRFPIANMGVDLID